jgi:predicted RNase H-like HicB family nuclease
MTNEFTAIIEKHDKWFVGYCPEVPGANGQGKTHKECKENLSAAIALILEDRRRDAFKALPKDAIKEMVVVR